MGFWRSFDERDLKAGGWQAVNYWYKTGLGHQQSIFCLAFALFSVPQLPGNWSWISHFVGPHLVAWKHKIWAYGTFAPCKHTCHDLKIENEVNDTVALFTILLSEKQVEERQEPKCGLWLVSISISLYWAFYKQNMVPNKANICLKSESKPLNKSSIIKGDNTNISAFCSLKHKKTKPVGSTELMGVQIRDKACKICEWILEMLYIDLCMVQHERLVPVTSSSILVSLEHSHTFLENLVL